MKQVKAMCDVLIEVFGMQQWQVKVERVHKSGGADVAICHRYRRINIRILDGFFKETLAWQSSTLIHEFTHSFNLPVYNLLEMQWAGKLVTEEHADDILEQCNTRAEKVLVKILTDNKLKIAYVKYNKRGGIKRLNAGKKPRIKPRATKKVSKCGYNKIHAKRG